MSGPDTACTRVLPVSAIPSTARVCAQRQRQRHTPPRRARRQRPTHLHEGSLTNGGQGPGRGTPPTSPNAQTTTATMPARGAERPRGGVSLLTPPRASPAPRRRVCPPTAHASRAPPRTRSRRWFGAATAASSSARGGRWRAAPAPSAAPVTAVAGCLPEALPEATPAATPEARRAATSEATSASEQSRGPLH